MPKDEGNSSFFNPISTSSIHFLFNYSIVIQTWLAPRRVMGEGEVTVNVFHYFLLSVTFLIDFLMSVLSCIFLQSCRFILVSFSFH